MNFDSNYVKIDLDAIADNFDAVEKKTGVPVMAIIKADAYGHGAVQVARLLENRCAFFGVSSILEAMELRQAGLQKPILILGRTPVAALSQAVKMGIRPTIFHYDDALALSREARALGLTAPFHFAVDTGMGRIGFHPTEEAADLCVKIAKLPHLRAEGLFSHFATADCTDLSKARAQAKLFDRFDGMLKDRGLQIPIRHLDNSAGLMNFPHHYEMVRSGIVTYGMYPSSEVEPSLLPLRPALQWLSRVTHVKTLPAGCPISYGGTFVTNRPTVVATVPVGYADGYRRSLSGKFHVLIRGQKAPILGRICMDQMMVDVTDIEDASVGDVATIIGGDGDEFISADEVARLAGTIGYEIVCGISKRVPRVYTEDGEVTGVLKMLRD